MTPSNPSSTPLVAFTLNALTAHGWSQRRLAEAAVLSQGALSRVLRGRATPETATVEKIADALGVLRLELLKLLATEPANLVATPPRDPDVAYLARRLENLPPTPRKAVIGVIEALLAVVAIRRTRGETHAEFVAVYQAFAAHHTTLQAARAEVAQRVLAEGLVPTLQRFRLLVSDLYALAEMERAPAPLFLIRHILEQVDTLLLYLGQTGMRRGRGAIGRGIAERVERIVLLQGDLGHYLLGEAAATAAGMVPQQRPTPRPLVKPLYDGLDGASAARWG